MSKKYTSISYNIVKARAHSHICVTYVGCVGNTDLTGHQVSA